jgi:hypothetical protein
MLLPLRGLRAGFTFQLLGAAKEAVLPMIAKSASVFSLSYLLCTLSLTQPLLPKKFSTFVNRFR